ncbi:hypothetical protein MHYP_G00294490 [Metynnis hypsauchen]
MTLQVWKKQRPPEDSARFSAQITSSVSALKCRFCCEQKEKLHRLQSVALKRRDAPQHLFCTCLTHKHQALTRYMCFTCI